MDPDRGEASSNGPMASIRYEAQNPPEQLPPTAASQHWYVSPYFMPMFYFIFLVSGDALLIDTSPGDPTWTCQATESEIQHLLTKDYVTPAQLVNWMKSVRFYF